MTRRAADAFRATLCMMALAACGGGSSTGPAAVVVDVHGTYEGNFAINADQALIDQATMRIKQTGKNVSGTLDVSTGLSATFTGTLNGQHLTLVFNFGGECAGNAQSEADFLLNGALLAGTFSASDCTGKYTGGYSLDKL